MRFCFYSGYRDLKGGYTTLLLTLIKELYKQKQEVVLINYEKGLIAEELAKVNVSIKIIDLDTLNWKEIDKQIVPTDLFIITSFEEVYHHLMKINPVVIFYDINDFISRISDYKFNIKLPLLGKKLIQQLELDHSLWFMDDTGNFNLRKEFNLKIEQPVFMPIPIAVPPTNYYFSREMIKDAALRLTYIGRAVNWKMMPLKKILDDVTKLSHDRGIMFSVVVDDVKEMSRFINITDYANINGFHLNVIENMKPSEIDHFLSNNSDLHFAMGTAALDAASLGIPTIVMDYSAEPLPENYSYQWLYEVKDYSLGKNLQKRTPATGRTMQEIIIKIAADQGYVSTVSDLLFNYVLKAHSAEKVVRKIIALSGKARFRLQAARHYIPFYFNLHQVMKSVSATFSRK